MADDLYELAARRLAAGEPTVLALVLETRGSTPQGRGAKALVGAAGLVGGTIGGGAVEHAACRAARDCLRTGRAGGLEVDLTHVALTEPGPVCGGVARVGLVLVTAPAFAAVAAARAAGQAAALALVVSGPAAGEAGWATDPGDRGGPVALAELAGEALRDRVAGLRTTAAGEVYCELVEPRERLWIAGAGHVGAAVARLARQVDFAVTVLDDRADLNQPARIPGVGHRVGPPADLLAAREYGPQDYVVIVTRGHREDAAALRAVVRSGARYVGLIGSRRKTALLAADLVATAAATPAELARVFAPIGLDLGAVTVEEIAVAIVAELIAVRRGRLATPAERPGWAPTGGACPAAGDP